MKIRTTTLLAAILSASAFAADAGSASSSASTSVAEQRLRQDMQLMLSRMSASGLLGEHPDQVQISVQEPSRRVADLGVLVDSTSADRAHDGLRILGTTPGGSAEHGGLRPGDVIVSVNGTSLRGLGADTDGRALAAATLRSSVNEATESSNLHLDVLRNGDVLAMNVPVQSVFLPAMRVELGAAAVADQSPGMSAGGCGRVSTFDVAPRSERIYHATILQLDGKTPGPSGQENYRVAAGQHKLLVAEDIPIRQMGTGAIGSLRSRLDTHKELTIDVKPGTTAMIGAKFHDDKATKFAHGEYWDPVMWREASENCP
jgi:hypothetical protein